MMVRPPQSEFKSEHVQALNECWNKIAGLQAKLVSILQGNENVIFVVFFSTNFYQSDILYLHQTKIYMLACKFTETGPHQSQTASRMKVHSSRGSHDLWAGLFHGALVRHWKSIWSSCIFRSIHPLLLSCHQHLQTTSFVLTSVLSAGFTRIRHGIFLYLPFAYDNFMFIKYWDSWNKMCFFMYTHEVRS